MTSRLEQLKQYSTIVVDTGDMDAISVFAPTDATTNPSLVFAAAKLEVYQSVLDAARSQADAMPGDSQKKAAAMADELAVVFGRKILDKIPGRVSTEVDVRHSFDQDATIAAAESIIDRYAAYGVAKERVLIKIAATWEGVQAASILEARGIACNLTLIFCAEQAQLAADAGVTLISPFVGRITDWYKKNKPAMCDADPGVMSVQKIYQMIKEGGYATEIMATSFRTTDQIEALAGCDLLTISPALLSQLQQTDNLIERQLLSDCAERIEKNSFLEAQFRWQLNQNAMASQLLSDGIRRFYNDTAALIEQCHCLLQ